ncbi:MAG: response regulator [Elusimicrobia bacterium]|nr:response regulator [Elusimicrobiota bacterium]
MYYRIKAMTTENTQIVIVDDDPMVGELSKDLLTDEGYNVVLVQDSKEALDTIKANMPKLVVTDIMMPGISGMELCKEIKSDPVLKHIKIIVVSGKSYDIEKQRAFQLGADFFLQKPYNVDTFSKTVKSILDDSSGAAPAHPPSAPIKAAIIHDEVAEQMSDLNEKQIRFTIWGARSMPHSIPNLYSKYGRQTSCISIETKDNIFIFDAGTGIVELGKEIVAKKQYYKEIWLFITHFHLDHIIGLGNFKPIQDPNFTIHLVGANDPEKSLRETAQQAFYSSFSLAETTPKAKIDLYEVLEDNYELVPGIKVRTMYSNHPTNTLVYSWECLGKKIVYAPDSEILGDATAFQDYDEKFGLFCENSDILIHDTNYDDKDYETYKKTGHSGLSIVVDFAAEKAMAKEVIFFHLNMTYTDERLGVMLEAAQNQIISKAYTLRCRIAEEKNPIILEGN